MITYTSGCGLDWQVELRAAQLVGKSGTSQLPPPIGTINFHQIADPARYGLPVNHPLQKQFPNLKVIQYFMEVEDRFLVERGGERGGVKGVALYADYNGSHLSCSITSENGRNPLAPWDWEGKPGTPTDPRAQPCLEWRFIEVGGRKYPWFSGMIHGWEGWDGKEKGLDWRDGIPESVTTMFLRGQGRVGQSVFVPHEVAGLGAAEQTMEADDVKATYSILLFFPVAEAASQAKKLGHIWRISEFEGGVARAARGTLTLESKEEDESRGRGIQTYAGSKGRPLPEVMPDYKMATGGWITQHIIWNPFNFWSEYPEAVLVCWPVSERRAEALLSPTMGNRRQAF